MPDIFRVVMVPADGEDFSLRNPSDEIPYQRHDPRWTEGTNTKAPLLEEVKKHTGRGEETQTQNTNGQTQTEKHKTSPIAVLCG